jgi:hypothetical protein
MSGMILVVITPLSAAQIMLLIDWYLGGHFFDTQAALKESNWVTGGPKGAAVKLGMKRTTLAYRIRKLGIPVRPQL